jgi:hypothetical protein
MSLSNKNYRPDGTKRLETRKTISSRRRRRQDNEQQEQQEKQKQEKQPSLIKQPLNKKAMRQSKRIASIENNKMREIKVQRLWNDNEVDEFEHDKKLEFVEYDQINSVLDYDDYDDYDEYMSLSKYIIPVYESKSDCFCDLCR